MFISEFPEPGSTSSWNEDLVFAAIAKPARRKLLRILAMDGPQTAADLIAVANTLGSYANNSKKLASILKKLNPLLEAGIVLQEENIRNRYRTVYRVSPRLKVTTSYDAVEIDFGFCVVRLSPHDD